MTISYRVRKQIVDYFAQRKSSQEIASMLNVSLDQIQDWRRRYKHGHEDWVFSWDVGTKNGPDRSALLGHNFVYQETKPHGFYSSYFHQRISS